MSCASRAVAAGLLLVQEDSGRDLDALLVLLEHVLDALLDVLQLGVRGLLDLVVLIWITQTAGQTLEGETGNGGRP
eukprot:scaffold141696_cov151-Phaeocystis_antarctica.AAC.1